MPTYARLAFVDRVVADPGLRSRLKEPGTVGAAVRELAAIDADAARAVEALLGPTFATTNVRVGDGGVNVIPSHGEAIVDCRLLPGQSEGDVGREVARALTDVEAWWEMEFLNFGQSNESPAESPLRQAITETMEELVPGAEVICGHSSGFTDSAHFRNAFPGVVAYGFSPFVVEDGASISPRLHSRDERIAVRDLVLLALFSERLAVRLLA